MLVFDLRAHLRSVALRALPWLAAIVIAIGLALYLM